MATPLVATWRLAMEYSCGGVPHKARAYCLPETTTPGSITLADRAGATPIPFEDAAAKWAGSYSYLLPAGATFSQVRIEHFASAVWNPIDSVSVAPTVSGTLVKASQCTMTLRDTGFHKVRQLVIDTNQTVPAKTTSPTVGTAALQSFIAFYVGNAEGTAAPYRWMKGRSLLYLADAPFVGVAGDLNDKIRRDWGLT